jgi:hypothetical protein
MPIFPYKTFFTAAAWLRAGVVLCALTLLWLAIGWAVSLP